MNIIKIYTVLFCVTFSLPSIAEFKIGIAEIFDQHAPFIQKDLERAYKHANINAQFYVIPTQRAVMMANSGSFDALDLRFDDPTNLNNMIKVPVSLYNIDHMYAWSLNENNDMRFDTLESLRNVRLIALKGSTFNKELQLLNLNIEYVKDIEQAKLLMDSNRIEYLLLSDGLVGSLKSQGLDFDIHIVSYPIMTHEFFHYIHKSKESLMPTLTNSFKYLKEQGHFVRPY